MTYNEYVWWVDDNKIAIAYTDGDGTYSTPPEGKIVLLYAKKLTQDLNTSDDTWEAENKIIPSQFHKYIVDGVIAELYLRPDGNAALSDRFQMRFNKGVAEATIYANRGNVSDWIKPADYGIF
jgi:hypothetical protein